ncbi:MAG: Chromate transport protein ChrA [uncultured Paraburkholderia sp.]|nr:MAG: Chromate transport protein ChrA [uncultured Paraburkholderia sp.]CAH2924862.1 MAG: Chromate transport protein ChrA [uncultured Paraburkholderia sp.]
MNEPTHDSDPEFDEANAVASLENAANGDDHGPAATPTLLELFLIFSRIGLTSFGGGLSGWFLREFVHDRHWLTEDEFLNGLALSQALPGVTVKNLAIWIGHRLLGWPGAVVGFCGIIFPPAVVIVILGVFFSAIDGFPLTHIALASAAAGTIGLSLSMAITAVRRLPRRAVPYVIFTATFVAVAVFALPLVWTVLVAGSLSVAYEYIRLARGA